LATANANTFVERRGIGDLKDVVRLVDEDLRAVEALFAEQLRSPIRLIEEMGRYVRDGGGKRIRPTLLLLAGRLCGHRSEQAVLLATVVELIHTATLLHDDIIDEATTRRGRQSVNRRWGNDATVLLGDLLYSKSMGMALSQANLTILRLLSDVTVRMTEGELLAIARRGNLRVTQDEHLDLIRRKTADLFSAATRIGALLAGAPPERERSLAAYGLNLGICFQMIDDLLDFTGDERLLGKPVGSDLREGCLTLPVILVLRREGGTAAKRLQRMLQDGAKVDEVLQLVHEEGALDEARSMAERYAEAARRSLDLCEPSPFRDALLAAPDFILEREL
jgi:octaprenyl-diphosphate synthase